MELKFLRMVGEALTYEGDFSCTVKEDCCDECPFGKIDCTSEYEVYKKAKELIPELKGSIYSDEAIDGLENQIDELQDEIDELQKDIDVKRELIKKLK